MPSKSTSKTKTSLTKKNKAKTKTKTKKPAAKAAPRAKSAAQKVERVIDAPIKSKAIARTLMAAEPDSNYRPKDDEPFMNERQREYFRRKLTAWREEIIRESRETLNVLQTEKENHPDLTDRASFETDRAVELRARDRQRKLIAKINAAISRIEDGTYGYCEETGEPISLRRLEARPIATLSIEAQERHERNEKVHRDD